MLFLNIFYSTISCTCLRLPDIWVWIKLNSRLDYQQCPNRGYIPGFFGLEPLGSLVISDPLISLLPALLFFCTTESLTLSKPACSQPLLNCRIHQYIAMQTLDILII